MLHFNRQTNKILQCGSGRVQIYKKNLQDVSPIETRTHYIWARFHCYTYRLRAFGGQGQDLCGNITDNREASTESWPLEDSTNHVFM